MHLVGSLCTVSSLFIVHRHVMHFSQINYNSPSCITFYFKYCYMFRPLPAAIIRLLCIMWSTLYMYTCDLYNVQQREPKRAVFLLARTARLSLAPSNKKWMNNWSCEDATVLTSVCDSNYVRKDRLWHWTACQDGGTAVRPVNKRTYYKQPTVSENTPAIQEKRCISCPISAAYALQEAEIHNLKN